MLMGITDSLARIMHKSSTAATKSFAVLHRPCDPQAGAPTSIGRNFRNMAEILRNVGGTSGAEQLDPENNSHPGEARGL